MSINDWLRLRSEQEPPVFSFEYFPPKKAANMQKLGETIRTMSEVHPWWVNVSWPADGSVRDQTLQICGTAGLHHHLDVMMHLTCVGLRRSEAAEILEQARENGVRNLLVTKGNCGDVSLERGDFPFAVDLVSFIRKEYQDFCIAVAAQPEAEGDELQFLKLKMDAGADFIITDKLWDAQLYVDFVRRARAVGIECDIFPAVMPIRNLATIRKLSTRAEVQLPARLLEDFEACGEDDEKMLDCGVHHAMQLCQDLIQGGAPGVHLLTMNYPDRKSVV